MKVEIDAATINAAVTKAIVDSAIGAHIQKAVDSALHSSYGNPIDAALNKVILETAHQIVFVEYRERIKAKVIEKMTDDVIDGAVNAMWDKLMRLS